MARGREFVWKESDGNVPIADWLANEIRLYAKRKFGVDVAVTIRPQPPSSAAGLHEAIGLHKAEKSPASGKSGSGKSKGERPGGGNPANGKPANGKPKNGKPASGCGQADSGKADRRQTVSPQADAGKR